MGTRWWSAKRLAIALALAGAVPAVAAAAAADVWQIHLTSAGQAAARGAVLKRGDLPGSGWAGGAQKPDTSDQQPCSNFHPKQSDLVLIGAADTVWRHAGTEVQSAANVLRTEKMVRLDWQRTAIAPEVMPCLREGVKKELAPAKLVFFDRLAFPKLGPRSLAFRAVADVPSGSQTVRVTVDVVVFAHRRTEGTLSLIAAADSMPALRTTEIRLARLLYSRSR